ncbi:AMP-binding protein, partial [uncultured Caballeronia sp.]|uniref:AMP-binding protein n=1 Tax=uncultured Caballeronia sp. TaxID=1827198 RepID=UPI0035C9C1AC
MYPIDFFWRAAQRYPERTAAVSGDREVSFQMLAREVFEQAAALSDLDSRLGVPVCVGAANSYEHFVTILSVLAAGKIWVPLNPRNGDPELRRAVDFVEPAMVLGDAAMVERLVRFAPQTRLLSEVAGH